METVIKAGDCTCSINSHGAELRSFRKDGKEYMWQADPRYWGRTAPVLFPFVGAVADNCYRYEGVSYPMGQHGFARDMDFELIEQKEESVRYRLVSNETSRAKYPFEFALEIGYQLVGTELTVSWKVENTDTKELLFSIGAHPAFNCCIPEAKLRIGKNGYGLEHITNSVFDNGLLSHDKAEITLKDGILEMDEHTFDGDALVIENSQVDCVELLDKQDNVILQVKFTAPLVGIWSPPKKNAPFLCIEPWYGRADKRGFTGELSEREWGNSLQSGESFEVSYSIVI